MRITDTSMTSRATHAKAEEHRSEERFRAWVDGRETSGAGGPRPRVVNARGEVGRVEISALAASLSIEASQMRSTTITVDPKKEIAAIDEEERQNVDVELEVMRLILEKTTGLKLEALDSRRLRRDLEEAQQRGHDAGERAHRAVAERGEGAPQRVGWGLDYERTEIHQEMEHTSFESSGVVQTADGRQIAFDVELTMHREHLEVDHLRVQAGDAQLKDPLVVNFNGNAAELTGTVFDFDLDADGDIDRVPGLGAGSAFLVLDKDVDGVVDDGTELFGPTTGDGFAELAAHDEDGNGWIDESDSVFARLQVWRPDADGQGTLRTLSDAGVGAISVAAQKTPFELKNDENEQVGAVRATSVYLEEEGGVGTVQHVDIKV